MSLNNKMSFGKLILGAVLLGGLLGSLGCQKGSTDTSPTAGDIGDDQFVAGDDNAGKITLSVNDTEMQVSEISGFEVSVTNVLGQGVGGLKISCDTEDGLAIIEPTTGTEITDSGGKISGVVGCSTPGSYVMACRLPIGANKRKLQTIKCSGPVPTGFDGFPGSSGGGLGTGGSDSDDDGGQGGTDTDGVRITDLAAYDDGTSSGDGSNSIDTSVGLCGTDDETTDEDERTTEPFYDTQIRVQVVNNTNQTVNFTSMTYTVPNADGSGTRFTSDPIALIGEADPGATPADGGTNSFVVLFFDAVGSGKRFYGASANMPTSLGFRNITVRLTGTNEVGDTVTITGQIALSFDAFDNCG